MTPQISFLLVKNLVKYQNMSSSFSTILNYSNKFQMIIQSCSSGHLALKTRKSKSQLLKPHISLKILTWMGKFVFECILNPLNHLGKFYITISNCPNGFYAQIFSKTRFDILSFQNLWKLAFKNIKTIIRCKLIKFLCLRKFKTFKSRYLSSLCS